MLRGSYLATISPEYDVWEDVAAGYVYPFIFISDSNWTVDLCAQVLPGYRIVGVYDVNGDLVSNAHCVHTLVTGETKVLAFEVIDVGSPEPRLTATLRARSPHGQLTEIILSVPGIRVAEEHAPPDGPGRGPLSNGLLGGSLASTILLVSVASVAVARLRHRGE